MASLAFVGNVVAELIADPFWRSLAAGEADQQQRFQTEITRRLGRSHYSSEFDGDGITHWDEVHAASSREHCTTNDADTFSSASNGKVHILI